MFQLDQTYSKEDIYSILGVPKTAQKGNWNTGYHEYNGAFYIFANVGVPGRTGHDYNNKWDKAGHLLWEGKTNSHLAQQSIKKMLDPSTTVHIFIRYKDREPFTYKGTARAQAPQPTTPVRLTWILAQNTSTISKLSLKTTLVIDAPDDLLRMPVTTQLRIRRGQGIMRDNLLRLYDGRCCISGTNIEDVLDACHIFLHSKTGDNRSTNGLLLRSDIHDLFDAGLIGINPYTLKVAINKALADTEYARFDGQALAKRKDNKRPDRAALIERWKSFCL